MAKETFTKLPNELSTLCKVDCSMTIYAMCESCGETLEFKVKSIIYDSNILLKMIPCKSCIDNAVRAGLA